MRVGKSIYLISILCLLFITASACNLPTGSSAATPVPSPIQVTAVPTSLPGPEQTGDIPGDFLPDKRSDHAGDVDSSPFAKKKAAPGGDIFVKDLYERPFNADSMDTYFPYLDIIDTQGFKDDTWGYATISLSGTDESVKLPAVYGVELDTTKDGRGDWLILASAPSSTDWATSGVKAWQDANKTVGGETPIYADKPPDGDGYETLVFDEGKTDIPDGAWVRISADDPKTVELAFKLSMLGDPDSFAMGAWAGAADHLDPAKFDFNDNMTHIDAGSPLPDLFVYPLKGLSEIDNPCRLAVGFAATGSVPGLCITVIPHQPGQPGQPGQPSCPNTCSYGQDPYPSCICWPG